MKLTSAINFAQPVAKGGFANSKDSNKHQTSPWKTKKPKAADSWYSIGEEADGIFYSFGLSDDDRKKYNTVKNKSKDHFVKWRKLIYKWRF